MVSKRVNPELHWAVPTNMPKISSVIITSHNPPKLFPGICTPQGQIPTALVKPGTPAATASPKNTALKKRQWWCLFICSHTDMMNSPGFFATNKWEFCPRYSCSTFGVKLNLFFLIMFFPSFPSLKWLLGGKVCILGIFVHKNQYYSPALQV